MTIELKPQLTDNPGPRSLSKALGQNEQAADLVEECAAELSDVNEILTQELEDSPVRPQVESALAKSAAVEDKVQEAADQLSAVNEALQDEVKERHLLEHRLAAVTGQEALARHSALHDPLTGLPNRKLAGDRLEHGLEQAKRHGRMLAVMFMDLNGFKAINDTHGHEAGDCVLRTVAQRLTDNTRGDDTVSRLGGDEFLYLMTETASEEDVRSIASKLGVAIGSPFDVATSGGPVSVAVSASIGIAVYPKDGDTAECLVAHADQAMYRAKRDKSGHSFTP